MAPSVEIRPLRKDDHRGDFSCGQPDLDRFLEHYAGQNQFKLHIAVTYVATASERIVGYATIAAVSTATASRARGSASANRNNPSKLCARPVSSSNSAR